MKEKLSQYQLEHSMKNIIARLINGGFFMQLNFNHVFMMNCRFGILLFLLSIKGRNIL